MGGEKWGITLQEDSCCLYEYMHARRHTHTHIHTHKLDAKNKIQNNTECTTLRCGFSAV